MRRREIALWLVVVFLFNLALLLCVGSHLAQAQRVAQDRDVPRALAVAHGVFPSACYPAQVVVLADMPDDRLAEAYVGGDPCVIWLSPHWREWTPVFLCSVLAHETGHLAGFEHSTDPSNIMFPYLETTPRQCAGAWSARRRPHR